MEPRFTDDANPVFVSRYNRVSAKSVSGEKNVDPYGVYINPTVTRGAGTGNVIGIGLIVLNRSRNAETGSSPNSLGELQKIAFQLDGGKRLVLSIKDGYYEHTDTMAYKTPSTFPSTVGVECGIARLSLEQYQELVASRSVAVQIVGEKWSATFAAGDIEASFLPNLKAFYEKHLKPK